MTHNCIFCKIVAGEIPSTTVYKDEHVTAAPQSTEKTTAGNPFRLGMAPQPQPALLAVVRPRFAVQECRALIGGTVIHEDDFVIGIIQALNHQAQVFRKAHLQELQTKNLGCRQIGRAHV